MAWTWWEEVDRRFELHNAAHCSQAIVIKLLKG